MKKYWIAIFITISLLAGVVIWSLRRGKKVDLTAYKQSKEAADEMAGRVLNYTAPKSKIFDLITMNFYEGFDLDTYQDTFPVYSDSSTLFSAEMRPGNIGIAKEMISRYDKIVSEASQIHRVPRILIYGIMLAEHERSVSLKQAESYSRPGSKYIGLMQISATTANDSLSRNITYKKLSQAQIDLFTKKGIIKGTGENAVVNVTNSHLRTADLNIHAGAEYLSRHINSWGIFQPEKLVVSYNQGEGALKRDGLTKATAAKVYEFYKGKNSGQIAQVKGYLLKILGKHGACDILFNDLGIKD